MSEAITVPPATSRDEERRGYLATGFRRLLATRHGVIGLGIVSGLVLVALFGPMLTTWAYDKQDLAAVLAYGGPLPPLSPEHVLGTDRLGRDVLSRVIDGARVSMTVALVVQLAVLVIGVPVGLLAGWRGGWTDTGLMRLADILYVIPDLLFVIMITTALLDAEIFGVRVFPMMNGLLVIFIGIGLITWVGMARLVRAQVLVLRETGYVEAARAVGVSGRTIVRRHILPNATGVIIIAVSLGIPVAILVESTLSFLGLGIQIPRASWGSMIDIGIDNVTTAPWLLPPPLVALAVALLGFTLLGDGLRDAFDPKSNAGR
jgi:ABC-type dipeptide/oligopeptide/nickel transport system permease subunit